MAERQKPEFRKSFIEGFVQGLVWLTLVIPGLLLFDYFFDLAPAFECLAQIERQ